MWITHWFNNCICVVLEESIADVLLSICAVKCVSSFTGCVCLRFLSSKSMQLCSAEKAASLRSRFVCVKAVFFIQPYHLAAFWNKWEGVAQRWCLQAGSCIAGNQMENLWYKGQLKDGLQLPSTVRLYWHKFRLERNNCNYSVIADLCIKYYPGYR